MKRSPSKACLLPVRRLYSKKNSKTKRPDNRYFKTDNSHAKIGVRNMFKFESVVIGGRRLVTSSVFQAAATKEIYFNFSARPEFDGTIVIQFKHISEPQLSGQPIRIRPLDGHPNIAVVELINYNSLKTGEFLTTASPLLLATVTTSKGIKKSLYLELTVHKMTSPTHETLWQYEAMFFAEESR